MEYFQTSYSFKENYLLTDENKAEILAVFSKEIADVSSSRRGYKAHDVISLSNSTPNLDELLISKRTPSY